MLRGLLGISCLMVAGGCVALNSGFEDTASGTGGTESSDTGRSTASESGSDPSGGGSSAVTTVTPGDSGGVDPTDSVGESGGSLGTSGGDSDTSVSSGETGDVPCDPAVAGVIHDAFLQDCPADGDNCPHRNFGQTELESLASGVESSVLLLELPVTRRSVDRIDVTLSVLADADLAGVDFTINAFAIDPPCSWDEGQGDDSFLDQGEPGVTFAYCDGNPSDLFEWAPDPGGTVWDHVDEAWSGEVLDFAAGEVSVGKDFSLTIGLDRTVTGPTPQALLITSSAPGMGLLRVYSAESSLAPSVNVSSLCR